MPVGSSPVSPLTPDLDVPMTFHKHQCLLNSSSRVRHLWSLPLSLQFGGGLPVLGMTRDPTDIREQALVRNTQGSKARHLGSVFHSS